MDDISKSLILFALAVGIAFLFIGRGRSIREFKRYIWVTALSGTAVFIVSALFLAFVHYDNPWLKNGMMFVIITITAMATGKFTNRVYDLKS